MSEAAESARRSSADDESRMAMPEREGPEGRPSSTEIRRYRIVVDRDLCQGHGVCEGEAPHVFEVAKKATTVTVLDATPPESERAAVEAAVRYCPTHALHIEEIA